MLINILLRTHCRPNGFKRAYNSVINQTHKDIRLIVSHDHPACLSYIPEGVEKLKVIRREGKYFYDSYCNELKAKVDEGYFFFLDDDDYLSSTTVLTDLIPLLKQDEANIVNLKRGSMTYPIKREINTGRIGMPCLVLHHSYKLLADIPSTGAGDFVWIKNVSEILPINWIDKILVRSDSRGNGRVER